MPAHDVVLQGSFVLVKSTYRVEHYLQNADGTPFAFPKMIEVDNLGTERRLPEDTADNPQAPFECDSNYSVSTANLVRLLNL